MAKQGTTVSPKDRTTEVVTVSVLKTQLTEALQALVTWVASCKVCTFFTFETQLVPKVLALGGLLVQLFLCLRHERFEAQHSSAVPGYKRQGPYVREIGTFFGKVRYARTYFYRAGQGYYPLDNELGLTSDGFSMVIRSYASRLATKVS